MVVGGWVGCEVLVRSKNKKMPVTSTPAPVRMMHVGMASATATGSVDGGSSSASDGLPLLHFEYSLGAETWTTVSSSSSASDDTRQPVSVFKNQPASSSVVNASTAHAHKGASGDGVLGPFLDGLFARDNAEGTGAEAETEPDADAAVAVAVESELNARAFAALRAAIVAGERMARDVASLLVDIALARNSRSLTLSPTKNSPYSWAMVSQLPWIHTNNQIEKPIDANMGAIKAIAWHPLKPLLAILHRQDVIFIYDLRKSAFVGKNRGILMNEKMKDVTCMQWCPLSGGLLAVGTSTGVLLWRVFQDLPTDTVHFPLCTTFPPDSSVMASAHLIRPASNAASNPAEPPHTPPPRRHPTPAAAPAPAQATGRAFLTHLITHAQMVNVSALAFTADAVHLLAGLAHGAGLVVLDVARGEVVDAMGKIVGKGTVGIRVSADGRYLAQICRSKFLRVWSLDTMTSVDMECTTGPRFRDAAWMPDGRTLLIAMDGEAAPHANVGNLGCLNAVQMAGNGSLGESLLLVTP
ncbi:WD40-repeat-containing domain protein [Chytriomyces sp. MP71]|nr:WD40-repeat-containing domain protein [Chytriomyces sp. MP71]